MGVNREESGATASVPQTIQAVPQPLTSLCLVPPSGKCVLGSVIICLRDLQALNEA